MTVRRLSNNLAGEPFLNRRIPVVVAGALVCLALGATVANLLLFVLRGGEYRQYRAERAAQQERLKALAEQLRDQRRLLEGREVEDYVQMALLLQPILQSKRFSWNVFLEHLEAVKPYGVLFTDVSPRARKEGGLEVRLRGSANDRQEVLTLERNLLASPAFQSPQLEQEGQEGTSPLFQFTLTVVYTGSPGGAP